MAIKDEFTTTAYVKLKQVMDDLKQHMDNSETDPEYLTYKDAWNRLNKRYVKATELVTAAERREAQKSSKRPSQRGLPESAPAA